VPLAKHGALLSIALAVQSAELSAHNLMPMLLNRSGSKVRRKKI